MICPLCKYPKSSVENTLKFTKSIRRLHKCLNPACRRFYFTVETVIPELVFDEPPLNNPSDPDTTDNPEDDGEPELFPKN